MMTSPHRGFVESREKPEVKVSILIVDDDSTKRFALKTILAPLGEDVVEASSGADALRQLLRQEFAVLLLDVRMPMMDGFETAQLIRQRPRSELTPIIFVTALDQAETDMGKGYDLGAVDFVFAPVVPAILRAKVAVFVELYRAQQELRRYRSQLEMLVEERTTALTAVNRELEAFSYSVSHDLRAPLRHISGFSQLLVEEFGSTLDPNAQQYLERIQAGAQKMGVLVDELLNLARVGRHALNLQPTQLNAMVAEVIAILQPDCQGRQVEWIIADLPAVACDPVLVKQIFQNLLANALKFTRPRARAVIEVSHREEEDRRPVFMVRDNGVGFSMKYVDKLFGVFQRLHRVEEFEGTGIGLVTVQRIVRKHGGQVWAEGELDKGAAFYFTLEVGKQTESKNNAATAGGRL